MTISANGRPDDSEILRRSVELYRELSDSMLTRVACLTRRHRGSGDPTWTCGMLDAHRMVLGIISDVEAEIGRQGTTRSQGSDGELDLDAARTEILARLSAWTAEE